ncbi:hypothetical protein C8Q72DRAFT_524092 [Fomitopsis betulina]|nr:hypothetical protein C8Q72DRAFT_524092 [Fomitopsis betulina]
MNIMRLSPALAASQYVSKLHGNARAKRIGKLGIGHSTVADMSDVDSTDSGRERVSASSYRHRLSEIWIGHLQTVHGRRSALSRGRYRCSWQHRRSLLYEERISLNYATWSTFPIQPRSTVHTRPKTDGRSRKSDISSTPPKHTGGGDTHITTLQSVDAYVWPRYSREGYPETTPWMASLWTPFGVGNNHAQCCMSDLQPVVGYGIRNSRFGPGAHTARVRGSGTTKRGLRSRIG